MNKKHNIKHFSPGILLLLLLACPPAFAKKQQMNYVVEKPVKQTLLHIHTPEGRLIQRTNGTYRYEYTLTDHLGNARVSFTDEDGNGTPELLQEDHYYPFGLQMPGLHYAGGGTPENKYLYNGKELVDDEGINLYDYGFRFYDAALGRWHVIDEYTEKYYNISPYSFCLNNPLLIKDNQGKDVYIYYITPDNSTKGILGHNAIGIQLPEHKTISYFQASGNFVDRKEITESIPEEYGGGERFVEWYNDEGGTIKMYMDNGDIIYRMKTKLPDEVEQDLYGAIYDAIQNPATAKGSWCTIQVQKLIYDAYVMNGYSEEEAKKIVEKLLPGKFPKKMTEKEMKEAGYTEYTKYYKKGDEYKSETKQLNNTSPLNTERLQPGDAGYIGSFWELQDIVRKF